MRRLLLAFLLAALPSAAWAVYCGQYSTPGGSAPPPPGNTMTWASQAIGTCHYWVAASGGSDGNTGLSPATPFATLAKAKSSMEGNLNAAQKNTCLLAGTYTGQFPVTLTTADNGEVWQFDTRGNGNTAVLDGGSANDIFTLADNVNGVTFNGLHMQNIGCHAFGHDTGSGGVLNITVENNEINHDVGGFGCGAVAFNGLNGVNILHNYIHDIQEMGIRLNAFQAGLVFVNVLVDSNVVIATCESQNDCGAIYGENPGNNGASGTNGTQSNVVVSNNFVRDNGFTADAHDLYWDLGINNAKVFGNIFGPPNPNAGNSSGCMITDGFNDQFFNNICDTGSTGHDWAGIWWYESPPGFNIIGNTYTQNIVLGNYAGNETASAFGISGVAYAQTQGLPSAYSMGGNWYTNFLGGQALTTGSIQGDPTPNTATPANLKCTGYLYLLDPSSQAIAQGFPQIVGQWGPPQFVIPTSTNHSCPG